MSFRPLLPVLLVACGLALGACGPCQVNQAPVANAGENQISCVGQRVQLSALASADPDGDTLSYLWTNTLAPASNDLASRFIPEPSFVPTAGGVYEFSVTVADGCGGSDSDTVRVVAVPTSECGDCQSGKCCHDSDCDDGDSCTTDTCQDGICRHVSVPRCLQQCTPNSDCNDGDPCTTDTCINGGCQHVNNTNTCDDGDACTTCDHCSNGACIGTPMDCDDGNLCNGTETCRNGACRPGTPLNCDGGNPCTTDTCNAATGCVHTNNTLSCNDGNACTTGDHCANSVCVGTPMNCDDGVDCTLDSCVDGVCRHDPIHLCETECPPSGSTTDDLWACDLCVDVPKNMKQCIGLIVLPVDAAIEIVNEPSHGTLGPPNALGCYTPSPDYCGPDSFTYQARTADGRITRTATVSINVWCSQPDEECISYFQCYDREISPSGDQDLFTFGGAAGQRFTAYLDHGNTCGMTLRLDGPTGTTLCDTSLSARCTATSTTSSCYDFSAPYPDIQIDDFELPADGQYTVVADGCGGCTGAYRLCLSRNDAPVVRIECGQTITGGIGFLGDQDWFVFDGIAGQCITTYLNHGNTCGMVLRLDAPTGTTLCDTSLSTRCNATSTTSSCYDFSAPYPDIQIDNLKLPSSGTYRIRVDGCGGCMGDYELSLTCHGTSCP